MFFSRFLLALACIILGGGITAWGQIWQSWNGPGGGTVHDYKDYGYEMVATKGGVWKRNNKNERWESASISGLNADNIYRVIKTPDDNFWVATDKGIYQSLNASSWSPANYNLNPDEIKDMIYHDDWKALVAATSENGIWIKDNGGDIWRKYDRGINITRTACLHRTDNVFYITTRDTNLILAHVGDSFNPITIPLPFRSDTVVTALHSEVNGFIWGTTNAGTILQADLTNKKVNFVRKVTPARGKALSTITIAPGNRIIVTDEAGVFYESTDAGVTWKSVHALPVPEKVNKVLYQKSDIICWGVGQFGFVFLDLKANAWTTDADRLPATAVNALTWAGNENALAGMQNTGIALTLDKGTSWRAVNRGLINYQVQSLYGWGKDTIFCALTGGGVVVRSTASGLDWQVTGEEINSFGGQCFARDRNDRLYIGTVTDGVYLSDDRGNNWTRMDTTGLGTPNVQVIAISDGTTIWAGTRGAGVRRWNANNRRWDGFTSGLESLQITALLWNNTGKAMFCANNEGIHQLVNGQWIRRYRLPFGNLITGLVANKKGHLIASMNQSGIIYSRDNGITWKELNIGLPSAKILTLALNGKDELLAGMNGQGVYFLDAQNVSLEETSAEAIHAVLYPNPAKDEVNIRYQLSLSNGETTIQVYDLMGRTVENRTVSAPRGILTFPTTDWNNGIYGVKIMTGKQAVQHFKVVIQR
jgi:ligand-binding sensor domain-containing protein